MDQELQQTNQKVQYKDQKSYKKWTKIYTMYRSKATTNRPNFY